MAEEFVQLRCAGFRAYGPEDEIIGEPCGLRVWIHWRDAGDLDEPMCPRCGQADHGESRLEREPDLTEVLRSAGVTVR